MHPRGRPLGMRSALLKIMQLGLEAFRPVLQLRDTRLGRRRLHRDSLRTLLRVRYALALVIDRDRRLLADADAGQNPRDLARV